MAFDPMPAPAIVHVEYELDGSKVLQIRQENATYDIHNPIFDRTCSPFLDELDEQIRQRKETLAKLDGMIAAKYYQSVLSPTLWVAIDTDLCTTNKYKDDPRPEFHSPDHSRSWMNAYHKSVTLLKQEVEGLQRYAALLENDTGVVDTVTALEANIHKLEDVLDRIYVETQKFPSVGRYGIVIENINRIIEDHRTGRPAESDE